MISILIELTMRCRWWLGDLGCVSVGAVVPRYWSLGMIARAFTRKIVEIFPWTVLWTEVNFQLSASASADSRFDAMCITHNEQIEPIFDRKISRCCFSRCPRPLIEQFHFRITKKKMPEKWCSTRPAWASSVKHMQNVPTSNRFCERCWSNSRNGMCLWAANIRWRSKIVCN